MSAIFGRVEHSGRPIDGAEFRRSFEILRPYGSDLSETWIEGSCAAGRHLLHIAPAAKNEQLKGSESGIITVADAILDNRAELANALGLSQTQTAAASDSDLIHRSFVRWGEACVDHLVGDFAFAAIRPQSRDVFLARDHIGSRPLFWALRGQTLIFASSTEAIVSCREWGWPIDERVVAEYLFCPLFPVSKPFFKDIQAVPPGGYVAVRDGHASAKRWWNPSTTPTRRFGSQSDVVDACRTLLQRSVADRINTSGRIGAHFSGGIDSTGVAVMASRILRSRNQSVTRAYAWSPPISDLHPADHARDEREPIQELADAEEIPVTFGAADSVNFLNFIGRPLEFEGVADLADEIPVLATARADGLRVMLSGWGGDEAFSAHGQGYLASLVLSGRIGAAKRFAHSHTRSLKQPDILFQLFWHQVVHPLLPNLPYRLTSPYRSYIRNSSFASDGILQQYADLLESRRPIIKFGVDPNENLKRHVTAGHVTMRMESWAAWSAQYGFQYRYPLTDRRLLEFLFTLPADQLFLNDQPRGLARAVLSDCIPSSASKSDIANERLRRDTRDATWRAMAQELARGGFAEDCPWVDKRAFAAAVAAPMNQREQQNILVFAELFAAARILSLYQRATRSGWV